MNKLQRLADTNATEVMSGTVLLLHGSTVAEISAYVDILITRGLDLFYYGPGDRYVVARDSSEAAACMRN